MQHGSTLFLKAVILFIGSLVLAVCIFLLPTGIFTDNTGMYRPILLGMYIPAIPFFIGLYQAFNLLRSIDKNKAFSQRSVQSLKYIKYCAFIISGFYAGGLPYIYMVAEKDDAPGVILIGLIFTLAPFMVALLAAVLQEMFQNALKIKSENDLTV